MTEKMKSIFRIISILVACLSISNDCSTAEARPNIIFFFTDDQAYDTLGCYGNPNVMTPNMDKLGSQGVIFDRHYDTTAICMASRASVMTGLLEYKTGCNFMHGAMTKEIWRSSFPVLLRKSGYRTGFGGKFGFAVKEHPKDPGSENTYNNLPVDDFDFWVGGIGQTSYETKKNKYLASYAKDYPHSSRAYGAAGIDFIRESTKTKKPFCLTLFFKAPHRPTTPDPIFDEIYQNTVFRKLPNYGRKAGEHLAPQSKMGRQYPRFVDWGYHTDKSYQKALRTYNQQIYGVDFAMGMIMEELERQGVSDNTVIIFSSDNGFFNGSHGLGSKVLPYEEGARVPLIIYDPRQSKSGREGRRCDRVTGSIDITATILDLAGLKLPSNMDGQSLMPIVTGRKPSIRESLPLIQVWGPAGTLSLSVVTQSHKYIYWFYGEGMPPVEELFDLKNDPYEMVNIAEQTRSKIILNSMRQLYDAEVDKWEKHAVPYNAYQPFSTLFDRKVSWENKKKLIPRQFGR